MRTPPSRLRRFSRAAYESAARVASTAGGGDAAERLAAAVYASAVVEALAAEGELDATDTRIAVSALAEARDEPFAAAAFDLFLRTTASPTLLELPPRVAAEIQLKLLIHLDVAVEASVWRRVDGDSVDCVLALGAETTPKRLRTAAAQAPSTVDVGLSLVGSFQPPVGAGAPLRRARRSDRASRSTATRAVT